MTISVILPTALRQFADNQDSVTLDGNRVGDVLGQLVDNYPQLRSHLLGDNGQLRNFVNVFVNDQNIRDLQHQETPLKAGDELAIIPAVAGGANPPHCAKVKLAIWLLV